MWWWTVDRSCRQHPDARPCRRWWLERPRAWWRRSIFRAGVDARGCHSCGSYTFRRIPTSPPPAAYSVTRRRSSCGWMPRRCARRQRGGGARVCLPRRRGAEKMLLEWERSPLKCSCSGGSGDVQGVA